MWLVGQVVRLHTGQQFFRTSSTMEYRQNGWGQKAWNVEQAPDNAMQIVEFGAVFALRLRASTWNSTAPPGCTPK
jgi:hypothetical protein